MSNAQHNIDKKTVTLDFHGAPLSLETGWVAKQATGSVIVRQGETMVLVTVCSAKPRPDIDFFPLVVEYQERTYAAGRIPGGFFKREGRLSTEEILTCRLMDRPIRPLFPDGYYDEVQVIATVMSADGIHSPDILAITGASAALHISDLPFGGPLAAVRVGKIDGKFVINASPKDMKRSELELIVAGTETSLVMVEGEANVVPEQVVLDALYFGHEEIKKLIALQQQLRDKAGVPKKEVVIAGFNQEIEAKVKQLAEAKLVETNTIKGKHDRHEAASAVMKETVEALQAEFPEGASEMKEIMYDILNKDARRRIVHNHERIDGRKLDEVRPVSTEIGTIPRAHGSSMFTRGETQAIVTTTLGTADDAQRIDSLAGHSEKKFMLHYNFPPFSTGEVKMLRGPGRREVGHGNLAERALKVMMPEDTAFPYVVRVVSEITESNGSSSMASVCGGSMALMAAGVPIKDAVAGVAMGLVEDDKDPSKVAVLTDILGDEDHFGDMDFKVCGTKDGITALQMDIKCKGLSRPTMEQALEQARRARLHILGEMNKTIAEPSTALSQYAPQIETFKINPDKIRDVIGSGGKTIRSIVEATGVKIDISDDGTVKIASPDKAASQRAKDIIAGLVEEPEVGRVYTGVVKRVVDFGAFVEILPGTEGLVHISQLDHNRVEKVTDIVQEGDAIPVRVLDIDRQGRIRLSRKEALDE